MLCEFFGDVKRVRLEGGGAEEGEVLEGEDLGRTTGVEEERIRREDLLGVPMDVGVRRFREEDTVEVVEVVKVVDKVEY